MTTTAYDVRNRPTGTSRPISATNPTLESSTISYQGDTVVSTDPQGKTKTIITDAAGMRRRVQDHDGYYINYAKDAYGSPTSVTDSLGNTLLTASYAYGLAPFKVSVTDLVSNGSSTFTYDALGELTAWVSPSMNASGSSSQHQFQMQYDALSRPVQKTSTDPYMGESVTDTWQWGSSATLHNVGKLIGIGRSDVDHYCGTGTPVLTQFYSDRYSYDSLGRPSQRTLSDDDWESTACGTDTQYTYAWHYSATTGLLDTLNYPTSTSGYSLQLKYGYQNGRLSSISDVSDSPNVTVWTANSRDAAERITSETLGNGIVVNRSIDAVTGWLSAQQAGAGGGAAVQNQSYLYDLVGNVTQRQNNNLGLTENFYYDDLYRLSHSQLNGTTNLSLTYDAMGNITSRSDVASGASWTYDAVRRYQVLQAGSNTYTYSDAGTQLRHNGSVSTFWTPDGNLSGAIVSGNGAFFSYGPNNTKLTYSGSVEATSNIGELLEVAEYQPSYTPDYRHYVYAAGRPIAIYSRKTTGVNAWHYIVGDQQGGVASIQDSSGAVTANESFAAFGARRNATTWSGAETSANITAMDGVTFQGYNFQTTLEAPLGLTHMNGRVQDAVLGRFLSPDPLNADPTNTQSYNRYSYVMNNPLTFVDPTGNCWEDLDNSGDPSAPGFQVIPCPPPAPPAPPAPPEIPNWGQPSDPQFGANPLFGGSGGVQSVPPPKLTGLPLPKIPSLSKNWSWGQIKNWLCTAGNSVADAADQLGNVSGKTELAGLGVTGVGVVTAQPEIAGVGLALAGAGGVGNIGAGVLQLSAGLLQGVGGGGYGNSGYAALSLVSGAVLSRGIIGPATGGYRTVSQRAADAFSNGTATVVGGVNDAYTSFIDAAAPQQVGCPGGD